MTGFPAAAQLIVLAVCVFGVISGIALSAPAAIVIRRLQSWAPASRHSALMVLALAPAAIAGSLLTAALLPSLLSLFSPALDHCNVHDDGHAHLCLLHLPRAAASGIGWLLASIPLAWLAAGCIDDLLAVVRGQSLIRKISKIAKSSTEERYVELAVDSPVCVTVGIFRPRIVVSRGFRLSTSRAIAEAAIAHEEGHVRRLDTLHRLVARVATLFYVPFVRRQLLSALNVAAEQACDEHAALTVNDRLGVAEAIIQVERLLALNAPRQQTLLSVSFAQDAVQQRVESLLASPSIAHSRALLVIPLLVLLSLLLITSDQVHHMTESLLSGLLN